MNISVVVPFYNEEKFIERCVDGLGKQDYPKSDYEIILVDNNSSDKSPVIAARQEGIRLLHEKQPGDFAARNRGIGESAGDVIAFTDADTVPESDWLRQVDAAMRNEETVAVVGGVSFASSSRLLSMLEAYEDSKMRWIYGSGIDDVLVGYTCNMAVRRDALSEVGGFPSVRRNAEIVFLRGVIERYGRSAVKYQPEMRVNRLEISTLGRYYSKLHTYGRDYVRYGKLTRLRPLNTAERLQVFRGTVRRGGYSAMEAGTLLALLMIGGLSYEAGRMIGPDP